MSLSKLFFAGSRLALPRISCLVPNRNCSANCLNDDSNKSTCGGGSGDIKTGLVVGVYECNKQLELTPAIEDLDRKTDGRLKGYFNQLQGGQLKLGKPYIITDVVPEFGAIAITSLGPRDAGYDRLEDLDVGRENVRIGVGAGVRALARRGVTSCSVSVSQHQDAAAEAAELAAWRFQDLKLPENRLPCTTVAQYGSGSGASDSCPPPADECDPPPRCPPGEWRCGAVRGKCQNWARYLSDMPANKMTPVDFAQECIDVLCPLGVKVVAHDVNWIEAQRMECFLAVARGSCQDPIFLEIEYLGNSNENTSVMIAAKGVTFDSGGLCLKRPKWMLENRASMSGASAAVAAIRTLAELKIPANVTCCIPLCENMISGQCMKVGDVVRALNGLSIMPNYGKERDSAKIEDTDMEGKLLLADALVYGQYKHKPSVVIDLATCTHGIKLATDGGAFGCFSNSDQAWRCVRDAGACTGDRPWRMPLWQFYDRFISDDPAVDLKNRGTSKGAPCIGAAFLRNFICTDWVHMDITGVGKLAHACAPSYLDPERMTGRPTRTLTHFLQEISLNSIQKMKDGLAAEEQACKANQSCL